GEDVVAAAQTEIRDDRRDEPFGHVVDGGELLPAPAGLAVDPDPDLDLVVAEGERRGAGGGDDAGRQREAHRAALAVDLDGGRGHVGQAGARLRGRAGD